MANRRKSKEENQKDSRIAQESLNEAKKGFDSNWITTAIDIDCVDYARNLGDDLAKEKMTNTQVRNFFGEVKKIQAGKYTQNQVEFLLLSPKAAYTSARFKVEPNHRFNPDPAQNYQGIHKFRIIMDLAHAAVDTRNKEKAPQMFERYTDFLESILAYHRASPFNSGR